MTSKRESPFQTLKGVFHEPNRLAILSELCGSANGMTFQELKEECNLTDGNLSRHLRALDDARVIRIRKTFIKNRPQTTIFLTDKGRDRFMEYLQALEEVLARAAESVQPESRKGEFVQLAPRPSRS
jgi:DNA-binding MarR family transcriptional regulator